MRRWLLLVAAIAVATPAVAARTHNGFQEIEDFEGVASFDFGDPSPDDGILSGGSLIDATLALPAHSPTHVYSGTEIVFDVADKVDYSWPAVGAYVSGSAPVTLTLWAWVPDQAVEVQIASLSSSSQPSDEWLAIGDSFNNQFLTRAVFSSSAAFAIDDFSLGLPDVGPGIPEPASWALLITGFGIAGTARRIAGSRRTA